MCFHSKQSKSAQEVENRFNATIDNPLKFKQQNQINGFDYPETPIIVDERPNIITHYHWGLIPSWAKDEEIKKYTLKSKFYRFLNFSKEQRWNGDGHGRGAKTLSPLYVRLGKLEYKKL